MSFGTPFGYILLSGVFLFIDRFFKWQALNSWSAPISFGPYLGWEPFLNSGIAFGIVLPQYLIIFSSLIIIGIIFYVFYWHFSLENRITRFIQGVGLVIILTGAISNLIDRILYQRTIDYLRIFSGVINISDCLIVAGFVLYFWSLKYSK
ncbi:MAG: signal peptidase II [Patescibacteria group bacterium]